MTGQFLVHTYFTPGKTHSISNRRLAPSNAVVPVVSYGGDTYWSEKNYSNEINLETQKDILALLVTNNN